MLYDLLRDAIPTHAAHAQGRAVQSSGLAIRLDKKGNSQFRNLLFRRGVPRFYAFDLLSCNGEDLRYFPLAERKHRLRGVVPLDVERLLFCDHIEERGEHLFRLACKRDLEGIVAKRKFDPYLPDTAKWLVCHPST